jgi:DNA (cytosine-5)-methyltransferase 1
MVGMNRVDPVVAAKIERIKNNQKPKVLDLFAGCGGLSLGFDLAGFKIAAGVEFEPDAAKSHALNFHGGDDRHGKARDVGLPPSSLVRQLSLGKTAEAFDVIVGGPPCQAFARVGRPKLREINEHPEAFINDPRAKLYIDYLKYVKSCKPVALLLENVPDVLNHGGQNIAQDICDFLGEDFTCGYTLLNSVHYGVPQTRERMFLIAYRKELGVSEVTFPEPTHAYDLPQGYEGTRAVALKHINGNGGLFPVDNYYQAPPRSESGLPAITAEDAIGDLPPIYARKLLASGELKRGARRFDSMTPYLKKARLSAYAKMMKNWPGFESSQGLWDHVIRYLPRDYEIFSRMKEGDQYPEAHATAVKIFEEKLRAMQANGPKVSENSFAYQELWDACVPRYDVGKFPNKWRKIARGEPVRTLMAHLGKDSYSHIHYDNNQARTISVREAARLQSFPDGFRFVGTMNPAFKQIGNSVPPLMANALASHILITLRST